MRDFIKLRWGFSKYKKIFMEFSLNILAFSLLTIAQQLIAFPLISRFTDNNNFGQIILIFGIGNIMISMLGTTIGTARLLDNRYYNIKYLKVLIYSCLLIFTFSFIGYYIIFENLIQSLIFSIICILGAIRGFLISEYRIVNSHNWIFKQNFVYFLGLLIGCSVYYFSDNWLLVFLIPEIISVTYCLYYLINDGFLKRFKDKSELKMGNIIQLMFNNGLSYSLSQYDRFIIYPILGATKVSIYFTVTISSRMGALIMNPLSNYILGKLSNKRGTDKKTVKAIYFFSIGVMIVYFCFAVIMTPIIIKLLYPSFYSQIHNLLIPICLGASISSGNSVLKPVVLKAIGVRSFNKFFILYAIFLIVTTVLLGIYKDLFGIAIAYVISSFLLFIMLSISLKRVFRK